MHSFQLNVLGMDISFRTDADSARIERAQDFVEKQYERLKNQGGQFGREKLLTLLVLGVADDLLQTQQQLDGVETRLANLLELIEFRTGILTRRSGVISGVLFWDTAYTDPSFPLCGSCCLLLFPSECPPHALDDAVCRQLHDIA